MGAENSKSSRRPQSRAPNQDEMNQILRLQGLEYETTCREYEQAQLSTTVTQASAQNRASESPDLSPLRRMWETLPNLTDPFGTIRTANRNAAVLQRQENERCRERAQALRNGGQQPVTPQISQPNLQSIPSRVTNSPAPTSKSVNSTTASTSNRVATAQAERVNPVTTTPFRPPTAPTIHKPANNSSATPTSSTSTSLGRDRAPYSYTQNDLTNASSSSTALYPRLEEFVYVNKNYVNGPIPSAPSRDRSTSRSRAHRASNNDKHACPTCKSALGITIYNCPSGHGSCMDCKEARAPCGVCGLQLTDIRNRALEAFMAEIKIPCPNAEDGCCLHIKQAELEFHLKECPFNELQCPLVAIYKDCQWRGKISHVSDHVSEIHPQNCHINMDTEAYLPNICFDEQVMHFISMGPFKFTLTLKVCAADRMIYVLGQLLGTQVSAHKWNYEIQVYNKREPRRKYQYVDACQSASVPLADVIRDSGCGAIPLQHALTYLNEGVLTYKFYIKNTIEGKKEFVNKNHRGRGAQRRRPIPS